MNRIKKYILLFLISICDISFSFADISNRGKYSDFEDYNNKLDDIFIPIIAIILTFIGFIYMYYTIKEKYIPKKQSNSIKVTTPSYDNKIKQINRNHICGSILNLLCLFPVTFSFLKIFFICFLLTTSTSIFLLTKSHSTALLQVQALPS